MKVKQTKWIVSLQSVVHFVIPFNSAIFQGVHSTAAALLFSIFNLFIVIPGRDYSYKTFELWVFRPTSFMYLQYLSLQNVQAYDLYLHWNYTGGKIPRWLANLYSNALYGYPGIFFFKTWPSWQLIKVVKLWCGRSVFSVSQFRLDSLGNSDNNINQPGSYEESSDIMTLGLCLYAGVVKVFELELINK